MLNRARHALVPIASLALVAGLAGCGSDDQSGRQADRETDQSSESASPSPTTSSATPYLEPPVGVELTPPGSELGLGEEGVIAVELRQDDTATLAVTVERIERTSFRESFPGWTLDDVTAARTPYFVRLTVTNRSTDDLGGLKLDNIIWADDGTHLEAPAYYSEEQLPACSGGPLPDDFLTDESAELCQAYFIASDRVLESVTFQPPGGLEPITWTGDIGKVQPPKKKPRKPKSRG